MSAKGELSPADADYRLWKTVWIVLGSSILLFFGVAFSVEPMAPTQNPALERIPLTIAAAYVIVSIPAKRWLLAQAQELQSVLLRRAALVLPLVLCEVAAMTGIALRLVIGAPHYYVFLLLALAGLLMHFPRRAE